MNQVRVHLCNTVSSLFLVTLQNAVGQKILTKPFLAFLLSFALTLIQKWHDVLRDHYVKVR